jgi:hypothetical protein
MRAGVWAARQSPHSRAPGGMRSDVRATPGQPGSALAPIEQSVELGWPSQPGYQLGRDSAHGGHII